MNRFLNRTDLTNITGFVDGLNATNNETFTYTDQSRLSGATANVSNYGTRAWTYDANGNRLSETRNGTVNSYTYPATNNKLTNVKQGTTTTRAFLYDAAGNTTRDTRGATAYNYAVNNGEERFAKQIQSIALKALERPGTLVEGRASGP